MQPFKPKISREVFIDTIILEKEGPLKLSPYDGYKREFIKLPRQFVYASFMELCNKYAISYKCYSFINNSSNKETFKIVIYNDNISWYEMIYFNKNEDIANELALNLVGLLSIKLDNECFINKVTRNS